MRLCVIASFTLLCAGCGSTVVSADAAVPTDLAPLPDLAPLVDVTAPVDAPPAVDASRCDPSVLDDATVDDAGAPSAPYVVDLSINGSGHRCAIMSDRTLRCAGNNFYGELGFVAADPSARLNVPPTTVPGLRGVAQVVVNDNYGACARLDDGTVRCWGRNDFDALGVGHDGEDTCDGYACRTSPTLVPGLTDVVDLAGWLFGFCAVRADGTLWCWGRGANLIGPFNVPTPERVAAYTDVAGITALAAGWIVRFRDGSFDVPVPRDIFTVPTGATVLHNAATFHFCWTLPDSSMRCAGSNHFGELGGGASTDDIFTPPTDPGLCGVRGGSTGGSHTCVVLADRRVSCWGNIYGARFGRPETPEPDRCVSSLGEESCTLHPTVIAGVDRVDRVVTGPSSTCALRLDRSVWCWGALSPNEDQSPGPVQW
ncbi:MAG: hypothetical protein R3A52_08095 [Polyangiales bacterium]